MRDKVNLEDKFRQFSAHWQPKIVGELNGQYVKLARLKGEFVWHAHENEDELFLVVKGHLKIKLRERDVDLDTGEFFIVPAGVEHLPVADDEALVLLLEPKETAHTGALKTEGTVAIEDQEWL